MIASATTGPAPSGGHNARRAPAVMAVRASARSEQLLLQALPPLASHVRHVTTGGVVQQSGDLVRVEPGAAVGGGGDRR
jgi:hypothetical protein